MQPGPAQVAVDHHHLAVLGPGQDHGQVGHGGGLALRGRGTGDLEAVQRLVEAEELDRGAQRPVGLAGRRVGTLQGDDLGGPVAPGHGRDEAEDGQRRTGGPLEVVLGLDRVVQVLQEEDEADAKDEADG